MSVVFRDSHLAVFGNGETAEVFVRELGSTSRSRKGKTSVSLIMLLMLSCPGTCASARGAGAKGRVVK